MSHVAHIALILDAILLAFAFGATVWFFFVQSPVLLRMWGKEKFIPVQMRLTKTLFATLSIVIALIVGLTLVHGHDQIWTHALTAGVALFATLVNAFIVVPRALRAGGKALREVRKSEDDDRSVTGFASHGGGEPSKLWHRMVVLFVVVMLGGLGGHGYVLLSPAMPATAAHHAHGHAHAASEGGEVPDGPHAADAATNKNVRALHTVVQHALEHPDGAGVPGKVRAAFQRIFEECQMDGEAHEALHHYLIPLGEQIERLENASSDARTPILQAMDQHLSTFEKHFE